MRVCFVVPSTQHLTTAGVRIRYERLIADNPLDTFSMVVKTLEEISHVQDFDDVDVFIFSKTYAVLIEVIGRRLRERGKKIGIDLFDDYFTQSSDARLGYYRRWLSQHLGQFDFVLCSTPCIKGVVEQLLPGMPVLTLADPGPGVDARRLRASLRRKLRAARTSRTLDVLWFGIGDNPYFSIGLNDLFAYGGSLAGLRSQGWGVRLTVLTNRDSLSPAKLSQMARLPVPTTIVDWSLEAEAEQLEKAFACFIPVNGQSFSRAKSLNRAISAISAGCQALSTGYPLYRELGGVIYSDPAELARDLSGGAMRIGEESLPEVISLLLTNADPYAGAEALESFLRRIPAKPLAAAPGLPGLSSLKNQIKSGFPYNFGVVHGLDIDARAHKAAPRLGALTIASPYTKARLNFDVRFEHAVAGPLKVSVRRELIDAVASPYRAAFNRAEPAGLTPMLVLDPSATTLLGKLGDFAFLNHRSAIGDLCGYEPVMTGVVSLTRRLFPGIDVYVSDRNTAMPYAG